MRAVLLALTHFQHVLTNTAVQVATDNTTVVAYLANQGGTRSSLLCGLSWQVLSLCHHLGVTLSVRHIPGRLNVVADSLSRQIQPVNTEWCLHHNVFRHLCNVWDRPHVDLFATHINRLLPTFVSPVPHPEAWAVNALSVDWTQVLGYAFPPFALLPQVLQKLDSRPTTLLLIAPAWPRQSWFPSLLRLSWRHPLQLPVRKDLLFQHHMSVFHPKPEVLHLHAWWLCTTRSENEVSQKESLAASLPLTEILPGKYTSHSGKFSVLGVYNGLEIFSIPLYH